MEKPIYNEKGFTQWFWRVLHLENFKLGKNVQIGSFTVIDANKGVEIEDDVKIGWGCVILSYSSIKKKEGKISLMKNCKIGANTVIMPGITIGENAVIGANSFVDHSVDAGTVWAGSPIRFLKKIIDGQKTCY